jgi:hypothetical protein
MFRLSPSLDVENLYKTLCYFSPALIFFLLFSVTPQTVRSQNYISVFGGVNLQDEADVTDKFLVAGVQATATGSVESDNGYVAGITLGRRFDNISVELELSYRENDLDELDFDSISALGTTIAVNLGNVPIEGTHSSRSAMINGWVDLPMDSITTYVLVELELQTSIWKSTVFPERPLILTS